MQLFYNPNISEKTTCFTFSKDESKHIVKVLRKQIGDILYLTNGKGWLFTAKITQDAIKKCDAEIIEHVKHKPRCYQLHLAVAPTKKNDRFEWFLEKATEIGIHEITPIICEHSERKVIKLERYEKIIQSAMKQSLQTYLPKINPATAFSDFLNTKLKGQKFIAHCENSNKESLKTAIKTQTPITVLIGPEGDFSVKEIEKALQNEFIPVTLGKTRLRTETAALVACQTAAIIND